MRQQTINEFNDNIQRVDNLISVYKVLHDSNSADPMVCKDVLRASVVLMHAALEEVIRNLYVWILPNGSRDKLNKIPFNRNSDRNPKPIFLGDLMEYQGLFIENIVVDSINLYVDRMNLNSPEQLSACLNMVEINDQTLKVHYQGLEKLMSRRHQIVHQMDREDRLDPDTVNVSDIDLDTIILWRESFIKFFDDLVELLPNEP